MSLAVSFKSVERRFGTRQVLRGVTAEAHAGKVIGLLGRNGEGKSTLFRIALDLLAADGGEVEVLGRVPDGSGSIRQHVGYVPERPSFHEFMTVGEALALRSRLFLRWDHSRAQGLCRRLGLEADAPVRGASKGTLAKTAWVCAAAHDPALYLLDEPTSGLDALVREEVLQALVGELHERGRTVLAANHRMEELSGVLDEVWVLSGGVIAGTYDVGALRTQACRVVGRLKRRGSPPAGLRVVEMSAEGPLREWAALDAASAKALLGSGALVGVERFPLPLETVFKLLLKEPEGGRHA